MNNRRLEISQVTALPSYLPEALRRRRRAKMRSSLFGCATPISGVSRKPRSAQTAQNIQDKQKNVRRRGVNKGRGRGGRTRYHAWPYSLNRKSFFSVGFIHFFPALFLFFYFSKRRPKPTPAYSFFLGFHFCFSAFGFVFLRENPRPKPTA